MMLNLFEAQSFASSGGNGQVLSLATAFYVHGSLVLLNLTGADLSRRCRAACQHAVEYGTMSGILSASQYIG